MGRVIAFITPEMGKKLFCYFAAGTKTTNKPIFKQLKTIGQIINRENRSARKDMTKKSISYADDLRERLRDPKYAAEYLNAVLEDEENSNDAVFLLALRNVAEAFQISNVAEGAGINRENLYRMLSSKGNPTLNSLFAVLKALGLRFSVQAGKAA